MNLSVCLAALLICTAALPVAAQPSPTADEITESLRARKSVDDPLRGIKPPTVSTGPATPRRDATAASHVPEADGLPSINLNIQFRTGSAELTPAASHTLDELGRALSGETLASYHFRIVGHTDAPGNLEFNKRLSERRADAVVTYMVTRFGINQRRLDAAGLGSEDPLIPTMAAEPRNRRVQIINVGS